jgi:hypothetical protein
MMWHPGSWAGFRTMILRLFGPNPSEHLTVILLSNTRIIPPNTLASRIAKIYLNELQRGAPSPILSQEQLQEVVKNYHQGIINEPDAEDITLEDGELFVRDGTLGKLRLVPHKKETQVANNENGGSKLTMVFYIKGFEGFDNFRFDISGNNIFTPPMISVSKQEPLRQRRLIIR